MSRASWFQLFLFLHVVGAIAAVGPTLTYGLWSGMSERRSHEIRLFALVGIGWVDAHLATPAFILQAVTGGFLVWLGRFRFLHTAWLLVGVFLYVLVTVLAVALLAPLARRRNDLAERTVDQPEDRAMEAEYQRLAARARAVGIAVIFLTMGILYFMIVKPTLWSAG